MRRIAVISIKPNHSPAATALRWWSSDNEIRMASIHIPSVGQVREQHDSVYNVDDYLVNCLLASE